MSDICERAEAWLETAHPVSRAPYSMVRELWAALKSVRAQSSSSAIGSAGDDRPPRSDPHQVVERGGLPTTMPAALQRLDELRDYAAREIARLNSELNQTLAQRDIARNQRDDARAQLFGMAP